VSSRPTSSEATSSEAGPATPDPELAAMLDDRQRDKAAEFAEKRRRKEMQRMGFGRARDAGKAARHSAREFRRGES
jgi:hypothetical protein